jgi:hypothetical protein
MRIHVLAAVTLFAASFSLHAATDDPFVVHEWGTFTTVHAADGEQIWWTPPASVDLPDFVYRSEMSGNFSSKAVYHPKDQTALARMETPVIYFYSQRERVADVRVLFRGGILTEWYPQGTTVESQATPGTMAAPHTRQYLIEWNGIRVLPRDTREAKLPELIHGKAGDGDHYYIARDTDANFLRVSSPLARQSPEHERDLFYRGLGYFQAPLGVGMDADEQQLSLNAREAEQIRGAFLISIREGMMRYQKIDPAISNTASVIDPNLQPFGVLGDVRKLAMEDMARALVGAGLYEKEARAMVNTWQDQWYAEEGTRVLYLLPRAWTDRTLPLQVSPQPDSIVRVMVGRAELITPAIEQEIRKQILTFRTGDEQAKAQAVDGVRALRLGRFLNAAMTSITQGETDQQVLQAAWSLAHAASAEKVASAREAERSARN